MRKINQLIRKNWENKELINLSILILNINGFVSAMKKNGLDSWIKKEILTTFVSKKHASLVKTSTDWEP